MRVSSKIMLGMLFTVLAFGLMLSIWSMASNAETRQQIKEVDEFLDKYEHREENPSVTVETSVTAKAAVTEPPEESYTWNQEIIGKVVAFEVGWCCDQCKYYVACACLNRFYNWYDRDVVAMVTDGNDEYYQMNPEYLYADEENGFNFWDNYDDIMKIVGTATDKTISCYYWDNADTQGEWATLFWHCKEDGCYFYR